MVSRGLRETICKFAEYQGEWSGAVWAGLDAIDGFELKAMELSMEHLTEILECFWKLKRSTAGQLGSHSATSMWKP